MESDRTTCGHSAERLSAGDVVVENAASFAVEPEVIP
jgi:hypothetical protein